MQDIIECESDSECESECGSRDIEVVTDILVYHVYIP